MRSCTTTEPTRRARLRSGATRQEGEQPRTRVLPHRLAVKQPRPAAEVAAQDEQPRDRPRLHVVVRAEDVAQGGEHLCVVEVQVRQDDERRLVLRRLLGRNELGFLGGREGADAEKVVVPVNLPAQGEVA